jgi:heme/copper-type cytochrome/quinol oxidase subunit 2
MKSTLFLLLWTLVSVPTQALLTMYGHHEHPEWNWDLIFVMEFAQFIFVVVLFMRSYHCENLHNDETKNTAARRGT